MMAKNISTNAVISRNSFGDQILFRTEGPFLLEKKTVYSRFLPSTVPIFLIKQKAYMYFVKK